jgi:hypothetical protein
MILKNKIHFIFLFASIAAFSIKFLFKINDIATIISLSIGVSGLLASIWQAAISVENNQEARVTKIQDDLTNKINEIRNISDNRDFYNEKQIQDLNEKFVELRSHLENHQALIGHQGVIEQLFIIKDKQAELRASVAAIGKQGELFFKLEKLETALKKLQES